jgi:hypothetical protein
MVFGLPAGKWKRHRSTKSLYAYSVGNHADGKENFGWAKYYLPKKEKLLLLRRVSPVRPAPAEFPQGWKAARVGG